MPEVSSTQLYLIPTPLAYYNIPTASFRSHQKISFNPYHSTTNSPMMIPASFRIATLFPDAAILVSRVAEPFICAVMEENVSDYFR